MSAWTTTQSVQESVEEAAFVSMDGNAIGARSVEEPAFVSMDECAEWTRIA